MRIVLAPHVPTPPDVVARMLALAAVGPGDVVYDLGCGDGRVCIAAARHFGARAVGVDIEPYWVERSTALARDAGVSDRVAFRVDDACTCDLREATVITLYLVHSSMRVMAERIRSHASPGTRVVSLSFPVAGWEPERVEAFTDEGGDARRLFLWRLPGVTRSA